MKLVANIYANCNTNANANANASVNANKIVVGIFYNDKNSYFSNGT